MVTTNLAEETRVIRQELEKGLLRSDRTRAPLGRYVVTEFEQKLGRYVATELEQELGRYVVTELEQKLGHYVATERSSA
ncbi:hypothetical protein F2Q69_00013439 [Brassica cretica]|uniref:Uncharacterized protein n=1 Tax=Brassica cretica TaxID=69181 RepID=A0A8S9QZJ8_BRACR|nr:hypothetical protein F2Q69_00013439 [Brassica cretica]